MLDLQRNRLVCASPRTWNTKPISRNTRLDTSGHTRKKIIKQRQWRQQREKKIHRIAKMRGKKTQITNNTMIYSAPGSLSQQLRSCELFTRLFNSINIQFSFSNFKLAARLAEQDIKKCKKNVWHSPLPFSRCCDYIVVCAWKLHADQSRWNIFLVLFFHYFVIQFSWDWFLLERRFTRITDCSITRLSI